MFKHLPLTRIHPYAYPSAIASMAANEQGMFWEMADALFENNKNLNDETIMALAQKIGLNVDLFKQQLLSPRVKEAVEKDIAQALLLDIKGTPTFFVNGRKLSGAKPYEAFKTIIEEELGKAGIATSKKNTLQKEVPQAKEEPLKKEPVAVKEEPPKEVKPQVKEEAVRLAVPAVKEEAKKEQVVAGKEAPPKEGKSDIKEGPVKKEQPKIPEPSPKKATVADQEKNIWIKPLIIIILIIILGLVAYYVFRRRQRKT